MTRKTMSILLSVLLILCFASGCERKSKEQEAESIISVEVQEIKKGNIENYYSTSGEIIPDQEVKLAASIQKRAKLLRANVGEDVRAGDILLEMDNEELKALVNKAKASLASAQANLAKAVRGARSQEIEQAKAGLTQAEASYKTAEQDYNRMKTLYEAGAVAKQQLDLVELQYISAKSQLKSSEEQLSLIEEGADAETIQSLQAQVQMAQASLEQAQAQLEQSYLISPISGIVAFRNIELGEMPPMGNPIFTIMNVSQVKVQFNVPEDVIQYINMGDEVKVAVTAAGTEEMTGKITQLSPASDFRYKTFPVEVTIENPSRILKPGMFAQVWIPLEKKEDVVFIPKEALAEENGAHYVYTVKNRIAHKTKIKIGIEDEKNIEVLDGIKEKDLVIISGKGLQNQAKVSIVKGGNPK